MKPLPPALNDPAWLHGASAFTTVRTRWGRALHWQAHLTRLSRSCAVLGLPDPDDIPPPALPTGLPWGLLRVTVTAEGTFWNHRPLDLGPRPRGGVRVFLTDVQTHPQLGLHKTGNYLPYRLAAAQAEAQGAFEGWLGGAGGHLTDGSRTSPLLELDGRLVMPAGGLPGVTRALFLQALGVPAHEEAVSLSALPRLTRAWICGAGVGVVPVCEVVGPDWILSLPVTWPTVDDPALEWPE